MKEKDRTAMTDPLTTGQEIVAWWETSTSVSEPADLADRIDAEIERLRAALRAVRDEIIYGGGEFEEPCIDKIYDFANKALKNDRT